MSGVAGRSGRKKFVPTPDQREVVKLLAGRGIPQEHIRRLIRNPQTGKPLSIKTLERAFATEIQTAKVELKLQVGRFIMDTILGRRPVNAKPIKNERVRATLAIFVAKTRLGWTVANRHQHVRDPIDAQDPRSSVQSLERLFNVLARRASKAEGTIQCRPVDGGSI
jgi:hypothetical protein